MADIFARKQYCNDKNCMNRIQIYICHIQCRLQYRACHSKTNWMGCFGRETGKKKTHTQHSTEVEREPTEQINTEKRRAAIILSFCRRKTAPIELVYWTYENTPIEAHTHTLNHLLREMPIINTDWGNREGAQKKRHIWKAQSAQNPMNC